MAFSMRSKVRVLHEGNWLPGVIMGISHLPDNNHRYDVALDKTTGKPATVFYAREADLQLVEEALPISCINNQLAYDRTRQRGM